MAKRNSDEEFLNEIREIKSNINDCLIKSFKKNRIDINNTDRSFFIFQTALINCKAILFLSEKNEENQKWVDLYKSHESWKKAALADPLTSDFVKDTIRDNTKTKKIPRGNDLIPELAKSLSEAYVFLTSQKILKKEETYLFLGSLLHECFPNNPAIEAMSEEAFKQAIKRMLKKE